MKRCVNSLTIFGPTEDIEKLKEEIQDGMEVISLEKILPTPQGIIDATNNDVISPKVVEQFGAVNVNAWRLKNWGCLKNAYNSKVLEEGTNLDIPEFVSDKVTSENIPDEVKSRMLNIRSAITMSFETDESPNNAIGQLSKKYPNVLVHYGYNSETEDVCGWAAIANGEIMAHKVYSDTINTIRAHVEPTKSADKVSLMDFDEDDN